MAVIVRITSADGSKVITKVLPAVPSNLKVPAGAMVEVIDQASGRKLPLSAEGADPDKRSDENAAENQSEDAAQVVTLETVEDWPAAEAALAAAETSAKQVDTAETAPTDFQYDGGSGGTGGVLLTIAAIAAVGVGVYVLADGDDNEDEIDVDIDPPAAPSGLDLAAEDDSGASSTDNVTNVTTGLTITGTAEAGSTVELFDGTSSLGTATAGTDGAFSIDVDLAAGTHTITATATDEAGNEGAASTALTITVVVEAPAAPTALDLAAADDTGVSSTDNLTSVTSGLTITGSAPANATVELFDGTASLGMTTADANGAFSRDVTLTSGTHAITARVTDAAGNVSASSGALNITIDAAAPAAPVSLDFDDDGQGNVTVTGTAEAGSIVQIFNGATGVGTVTAGSNGAFSLNLALDPGSYSLTARATDSAGNQGAASAPLDVTVGEATALVNASVDGLGDVIKLYFDAPLDEAAVPSASQFTVTNGAAATVTGVQVVNNQVILQLSAPIDPANPVSVSYAGGGLQGADDFDVPAFQDVAITNALSLTGSNAVSFGATESITLAGAEISAFDPATGRAFVTSFAGLQVIEIGDDLSMTLIGTIELGSNDLNSVAVHNGIVAVAVAADDKTQPGSVFLLDAAGTPGDPAMILNEVTVGALPDMLTFTPDGSKILVANEGELAEDGTDAEGSVSIIDVSGGASAATVTTADFTAFNDQIAALKAAGVRLFAGEEGFENTTVAQDLEPEYISVSPDGTTAFVTLQENNAIAILDIASGQFTDIVPLGLKSFLGLPVDFSDEDEVANLTTDNRVFGQYMPDAISSFTGTDGKTYYVIANEGDDRDDFLPEFLDGFEEASRVDDLELDPTVFPNAAELQDDFVLGRLTVSQAPGNNGDIDGDGDIDQLLAYGARSFSILSADGTIVFDSGSHIEEFFAANGLFDEDDLLNSGLFDDSRSDNKGPEPEGLTVGVYGDSVLAFVAIERGGGGVMVYDVTDPSNVSFVTHFRNFNDISPEGVVYIKAEDSPTGEAVLLVSNEVSNTLTAVEITEPGTYTLQLLHFADAEAKSLAIETAPNLAALVDAFEDDYVNSITLAGGDNYIPGLFFTAQADSSVADALGFNGGPRVDIAIHNAIGVEASTIGNHEFDRGTATFAGAIAPSGAYAGTLFPYLSANLDFAGDSALNPLFTETLDGDLEFADDLSGRIVPSAVIEENGELIGLVGATTQVLSTLTSTGGVNVDGTNQNDMELLAAQLQPYIDELRDQGVNKIIVMSHLQQIELEQALAPLLEGVDIILAAGSNTRLADGDDELIAFPGHDATAQGGYPIVTQGLDGAPTLIVNTDNEFTYLGRLVVDFDANGEIILGSLDARTSVNGAYAATAENVADAWNTTVDNLGETAFAEGTRGNEVQQLVDAVNAVLLDQGSNVYGYSEVYLEGARSAVRSEETNLGNLTADANAHAARAALGLSEDDVVVSFKNGGGIRDAIGTLSGTGSDVVFGPNEGGVVTELDVGAALAFNNGLVVFDTTPEGLLNILNSPNAFQAGNGGFAQLSGVEVSYDPGLPQGSRVIDVALVDGLGNKTALVDDGQVVAGAPATITMITLDFIAGNDGDGTEIAENGTNFRYVLVDEQGNLSVSGVLDIIADDDFDGDVVVDLGSYAGEDTLGEQLAFELYLGEFFGTPASAYDRVDTSAELDERIQNISVREDTVLDGLLPEASAFAFA